jgi:hypothetical protein
MSHRAVAHHFGVGWLVGLLAFGAGSSHAQRGVLRAVVLDSVGAPIPGVEVSIFSLSRMTRTDSAGRLTLAALPEGGFDVALRRLGYHAHSQHVVITGAPYDSVTITLAAQPVALSEVDVSAGERHLFFQGFDQRQRRGIGTFVTREQIEAQNTTTASDLFRTIPAVRLVHTSSGMGVRFPSNQVLHGRGSNLCTPMIWLDGQKVPGMEVDDLRATDIEAIELYRGAATTPPQFAAAGLVQCGAIVVWTRRRG